MASLVLPRECYFRRPRRTGGFTLVELLVVVGIIALLISILMPALGRARESANNLKCQAQQRQIVQAMILHADEHKGYMPMVGLPWPIAFDPVGLDDPRMEKYDYYGTGPDNYHIMSVLGALAPQLGQEIDARSLASLQADIQKGVVRKIFTCPSDANVNLKISATVWDGGTAYASYAFNEAAMGRATSTWWDGSGLTSVPHPHNRLRGQVAKFAHPAQLFLLTDASPRSDGGWLVYCDATADLTLRDFYVTTSGPPNNPHASMSPPPGVCANWDLIDTVRHHGRMNIAFADGHVENVLIDEGTLARVSMNVDFPAE